MSQQSITLNVSVRKTDEDSKLVDESLKGDSKAFRELFNKNVSRIFSFCRRISSDEALADELTQQVFVNAWEKLKMFRYECKFSSWLHKIAVNCYLMHLRKETAKENSVEELSSSAEKSISSTADLRIDIERAIANLPPQARTVLVLHDIEGYKHYEISEMMGIEAGTSKAHLHRARKLLREELSK